MKKILIVLAIFASVQVANAQTNISATKKAVETAQATAQNAKKAKGCNMVETCKRLYECI